MKLGMVQLVFVLTVVASLSGCVTRLPALIDPQDVTGGLVVGRDHCLDWRQISAVFTCCAVR
ncbi:hypothetical protein COMA1_10059 [Candidatus Nitrospira nitrosa]|uniref:Lipoprotein n=1 Tax=Candidatus Nitrospira nitrosa TaxID=1742972 RepID=A0A0S4L625_9BACT|nr:hypothetical protein [Candidatus Nitrospira nitrosa]CUS31334.1 hypothetical protein COMA1_10059 [Candidatus Nitrospira nitrosa]